MLIGRRNLSKEDRDELIRRLAASGRHTQKEIAETVGLTRSAVTKIVGEVKNSHSPTIKSTSAAEELEAKQREIERLKAEKDALAERERTNADKRRAVEMAFRWLTEEGRSLKSITDTEIAGMARVTRQLAHTMRSKIVEQIDTNGNDLQVLEVTKSEAKELTVTQKMKDEVKRG